MLLLVVAFVVGACLVARRTGEARGSSCDNAREYALPLPSSVRSGQFVDYEKRILDLLRRGDYRALGWCVDKGVRDTGPFVERVYYGTHPVVRIFYSPGVVQWLLGGRQGTIPDGAMIIKEQYAPPAARYTGLADRQLPRVTDWTVMIKDTRGSKDGWFWGEFFEDMRFDDDQFPFQYPWAGFGLYCVRCHSTAEREHTFAALNNIRGVPGQPLAFYDDGSWRTSAAAGASPHGRRQMRAAEPRAAASRPDPDFLKIFDVIAAVPRESVQTLPSETYDHVVAPAQGPGQFISSSQCLSCHAGLNGPFGPVMFLPSAPPVNGMTPGANVSPYGEWRWSPMGLAGRDPIFYS